MSAANANGSRYGCLVSFALMICSLVSLNYAFPGDSNQRLFVGLAIACLIGSYAAFDEWKASP